MKKKNRIFSLWLLNLLLAAVFPIVGYAQGGAPVDFMGFPSDLSTSALAVRQVTSQEYYAFKAINQALKNRFKKYPFTWSLIAPSQYSTPKALLEAGYAYEFLFHQVKLVKHRQTAAGIEEDHMREKNLFWVMIREVKTGTTYSPQRTPEQYPFAFKGFVKAVNKSFK